MKAVVTRVNSCISGDLFVCHEYTNTKLMRIFSHLFPYRNFCSIQEWIQAAVT